MRLALLFVTCFELMATDRRWTLDALLDLVTIGDVQISPDGKHIAYVTRARHAPSNRYHSSIWITRGEAPVKIEGTGSDSHPRWAPDGKSVAFLSRRSKITQIHLFDSTTRTIRKVTNSPTAITSFKWAPGGKQFGYLAVDPLTLEERERIQAGDDPIVAETNYKYSRVYTADVSIGKSHRLTVLNRHVLSFDWGPDASKIVYAAQPTPRGPDDFAIDLFELNLSSKEDRVLVHQSGQDHAPGYSRDGKFVVFHSQGGTDNFFARQHLGIVPSGGDKVRYLTDKFPADVFRGGTDVWWSPDNARIVFAAGNRTKDGIYELNVNTGESKELISTTLGPPGNFSVSNDGKRIAFLKSSALEPGDAFILENGTERRITSLNPHVKEYPPMVTRVVQWKSKDGMQMEGVLRLPPGYRKGASVPLIVELHGGPTGVALESYPIPRAYPTQMLLQEGFAVLAPNFRGSSNYGERLRLANIQSQGFGDYEDVMSGIDALIEQGIADPDRLGIMGWSYGGFLATWTIGHTNRFKAASIGGSSNDWINTYATNLRPRVIVETYFGAKPWDGWKNYQRHSPRFHLVNIKTPSLLLRGQLDSDGTAETFTALQDLGVPVEFVSYPREGHGIGEPLHQKDLMRRNLEWFRRWIKP